MEIWKDAVGFEGYLQVSTEGRCKSVGRWIKNIYGEPRWKPEAIVAKDGKSRYKSVGATIDGEKKSCALHRLVALTFIPNPEGKPVVNHIDGNTHNNAVSNLEWCTYKENTRHAYETGLIDSKKNAEAQRRKLEQRREWEAGELGRLIERRRVLVNELESITDRLDKKYPFWRAYSAV